MARRMPVPGARPFRTDVIPSMKPAPFDPRAGTVEVFSADDYPQGGEAWLRLRLGMPTASTFSTIMAKGKDGGESLGRRDLMRCLAGEILTGEPMESFTNKFMQRGKDMEPEARAHYEFTCGVQLQQVGFVRRELPRGRFVGCSPDSLVTPKRGLEIKTMSPHLMIELIESGRVPSEHRAQCQGTCWVAGLDEIDLMIFYRGMPALKFRFERDDVYIKEISDAVETFQWELNRLVESIRSRKP